MLNTYSFLTEHSYSLRPVSDDDDQQLILNKKKKTSGRSVSNRTNKTMSKKTSNRTISIDRSSSDKENTSTPVRSSTRQQTNSNSGKKQDKKKIPVKKTSTGAIRKKKGSVNTKPTKFIETFDASPSLSIEERVKLRRTKTIQPSTILLPKQTSKVRQYQTSSKKKPPIKQPLSKKSTKLFLGSGLDLDNIVLGNRQRRSVQT